MNAAFGASHTWNASSIGAVLYAAATNDDYTAYGGSNAVVLGHFGGGDGGLEGQFVELDRVDVAGRSLVFHNNTLVCGSWRDIILFDVSAGTLNQRAVLRGHTEWVRGVAAHGDWLASGSRDDTVRIWSMTTHEQLHCKTDHTGDVNAVCFSHNGRWLVSGGKDESVVFDATRDFARHTTLTLNDMVLAICFSHDDSLLAVGAYDGCSTIYSVDAFEPLRTLAGDHPALCVAWLGNDAASLVGGTMFGDLVVWNTSAGNVASQQKVHDRVIISLSFTSSFRTLLAVSHDMTARVFNVYNRAQSTATAALYRASLLVFRALRRSPLGFAEVMQRIAEAVAGDAPALAALSDAERTCIFTASRVSPLYRAQRRPTLEALSNFHAHMHWLRTETPAYHEGVELMRLNPPSAAAFA